MACDVLSPSNGTLQSEVSRDYGMYGLRTLSLLRLVASDDLRKRREGVVLNRDMAIMAENAILGPTLKLSSHCCGSFASQNCFSVRKLIKFQDGKDKNISNFGVQG